jgi:ribulose-5-phosphate 4-epimerase/fuculose-1-phosphate aldolase
MSDAINAAAEAIVHAGRSLFDRGLSAGSSGNISVKLEAGSLLLTPTNVSLGQLQADRLARFDPAGRHVAGDAPTKEAFLHRAVYQARPSAGAIVHLHASHSAAVSCMDGLDSEACLPPLTPYFVMKIGRLPLIPYHRPGDAALTPHIAALAPTHPAILLANHGPIVAGRSLAEAMSIIEELEETAKIFLLLRGSPTRPLSPEQITDLEQVFGAAGTPEDKLT